MGRTPDRRPGAPLSEEEGAFFDPQPTPAATPGEFKYLDSGRWSFFDGTGEYDPRSSGGISEAQHKIIRQLIHFINDGPAEGFASGAYKETTPAGPFPTLEVWYEDVTKAKKIISLATTWSGVIITQEVWDIYDTDGSTSLATVTDAISYSGVFETSRTRTIVVH